jgi:hypothetical protein
MKTIRENEKVRYDPKLIVPVGSEYDFWLNEEDDIYDVLYRDKSGES